MTTPEDIICETAHFFRVSPAMLSAPSRQEPLTTARHIAAYLIYFYLPAQSHRTIGRLLNRDGSTITKAINLMTGRIKREPQIDRAVRYLIKKMNLDAAPWQDPAQLDFMKVLYA